MFLQKKLTEIGATSMKIVIDTNYDKFKTTEEMLKLLEDYEKNPLA